MKKLVNFYNKFEEYTLFASLIIMVIIVFMQVISRNLFHYAFSWTEELARYIFIWQVWLGASIATRKGKHIRVEIIFNILKGKLKPYSLIVSDVIWFFFCIFLVYKSYQFTFSAYLTGNVSAAMSIPMYLIYISIPIGAAIMGIRLIGQINEHYNAFFRHSH